MKALILAAGKGNRLKELTLPYPKPMLKFKGKPLLEHNINLCKNYGITEIYINTHHLADRITEYFGDGKKFGVNISYSYENDLCGTSGALNNFVKYLKHSPFFVIYGDNYSEFDLLSLIKKQKDTNTIAVIGFHWREYTAESGVAEFEENFRIIRFIEKPRIGESSSNWVNAGVYYFHPEILNYIPKGYSDFSKDVFPKLIKENIPIYGVCSKNDVLSFDTPDMIKKSMEKDYGS